MIRTTIALALLGCGGGSGAAIDAPPASADASRVADARPDAMLDAPSWSAGIISIVQGQVPGGTISNVRAFFNDTGAFGAMTGSNGPCVAYANASDTSMSDGAIAIAGTTTALSLVPTGTGPDLGYDAQPDPPNPIFDAGSTITATGADIALTVTGPQTLAGFTPPTTSISRAAGFAATWTAESAADVEVLVSGANDELVCDVPDTGSYTVAPESLALLATTDDSVTVVVARVDQATGGTPSVRLYVASFIQSDSVALNP